jgi:hypothetical protein
VVQNIERVGVRYQNIDSKGVARFFALPLSAAFGLAIFCSIFWGRKVRCHKLAGATVEISNSGSARLELADSTEFRQTARRNWQTGLQLIFMGSMFVRPPLSGYCSGTKVI